MASGRRARRRATIWRIPEELWVLVKAVLPAREFLPSGGRPWILPRQVLDGVLYVLRTGCQWKAVPAIYGSSSTVHRRLPALGRHRGVGSDMAAAPRIL